MAAADPERFRGKKGESLKAEIKKAGVDDDGMESRSDAALGGLEVFDTAMQDSAGIIGRTITEALEEPLKEFSMGMIDFAKDPMGEMVKMWDKAAKDMAEAFKRYLTGEYNSKPDAPEVVAIKKVMAEAGNTTGSVATFVAKNKVAVSGTNPSGNKVLFEVGGIPIMGGTPSATAH